MKVKNNQNTNKETKENHEVIGPGFILSEARKTLNISQEVIAEKLNLTLIFIQKIERDEFDNKISSTYTRGYLKNYAKLVNVSKVDVIQRYNAVVSSVVRRSGMQSFSKKTKKQAQHNQLMWFSYFIFALLIALTIVWWSQEHSQHQSPSLPTHYNLITQKMDSSPIKVKSILATKKQDHALVSNTNMPQKFDDTTQKNPLSSKLIPTVLTSQLIFTFKGDCWVNIYDATGKRIAWGIKKAGYIMHISGQMPFNITLGKPELVMILFNGNKVDMSGFNVGNIAKFTLPIKP